MIEGTKVSITGFIAIKVRCRSRQASRFCLNRILEVFPKTLDILVVVTNDFSGKKGTSDMRSEHC